jgi:hypothetical protein
MSSVFQELRLPGVQQNIHEELLPHRSYEGTYAKVDSSLSQCCGSGMFIPDPDFYPFRISDPGSRIQDPKTATKETGWKKFVILLFVATNFTKLNTGIILFLKCWRKTIAPIFKELLKFLPKKLSQSSQKYGFGTKRHRIRDPVSRGQKDTGSRIRNTALSAEYHTVVVILRYTPEFTIFLVCLKNFILLGRCIAARNRISVVFAARPQQHGPTTTVISRPMLPGEYYQFGFFCAYIYPSLSTVILCRCLFRVYLISFTFIRIRL